MTAAPMAFAADYPPPSDGNGTVTPSRITAGECAVFSGGGFAPGATVVITDNGDDRGTSQASQKGEFAKELCYGADAEPGRHVLKGTGDADPGKPAAAASRSFLRMSSAQAAPKRTVTAVLWVEGVQETAPSQHGNAVSLPRTDGPASGGLAFTGFPVLVTAVVGVLLVGLGCVALIIGEARHRRLRRERRPVRLA